MSTPEPNEAPRENPPAAAPLDFDAWADLSARLLQRDEEQRLDILADEEVELDAWARCDERWSAELVSDIARGRMDRAHQYGARCADELKRRAAEASAPKAEPPREVAVASPPASEPRPAEPPAPISTPRQGPPPPVMPSFLAAAPLGAAPLAAAPLAAAQPISPLDGLEEEHTISVVLPPPSSRAPVPLPFSSKPSPEFVASFSAPRKAPAREPSAALDQTAPANAMSPIPVALPFGGQAAAPAPASASPRMTLQSYASLCAELSVTPEKSAEILRRYGIQDEAARRTLDQQWRARLQVHAPSQQEWQKLYTTYRDWLRRKTP